MIQNKKIRNNNEFLDQSQKYNDLGIQLLSDYHNSDNIYVLA